MLSIPFLSLALLAATALATNYGNQQCKAGYNGAGACLWAANYCKDDCSSFLRATVTPCPSTVTATATTTVTRSPTTTTSSTSVTNTNTITNTVTSVVTATADETATATSTTTITNTDDVPITTTTTIVTTAMTQTVSVTTDAPPVTVTVTAALKKRGRSAATLSTPKPLPPQITTAADVHARGANQKNKAPACTARTCSPDHLPWYAWGCHGAAQYSSACSCAGVKTRTTTLPARTTTVTTTSTVNKTPTVTATATITKTNTATATSVTVSTTTFTTTDMTVTVPQTSEVTVTETQTMTVSTTSTFSPPTVTVTVTETPTVTATVTPAPMCTGYNLVAVGGPYDGQFLKGSQPDPSATSYGFLQFTTDVTATDPFILRMNGHVYDNNIYGFVSSYTDLYYVLEMTDQSQSAYGTTYLTCSVSAGGTSVTGAVGTLNCNYGSAATLFYVCPDQGNNLLQSTGGTSGQSIGCSQISLAAVPDGTANC